MSTADTGSMGFWRKELIDVALDHETRVHMDEQLAWIAREPTNAKPYYHLAQFYRMNGDQDRALGLLLEAVRLDPAHAEAYVSLAEVYAIRGDYEAARKHAGIAEELGDGRATEMLRRHGLI